MGRKNGNARTVESMRREDDGRTNTGKRVGERRPAPRREGTRGAIVRNATRES